MPELVKGFPIVQTEKTHRKPALQTALDFTPDPVVKNFLKRSSFSQKMNYVFTRFELRISIRATNTIPLHSRIMQFQNLLSSDDIGGHQHRPSEQFVFCLADYSIAFSTCLVPAVSQIMVFLFRVSA